ncbi:hypothetical protein BT63DRAFT_460742 [Microthyrium microscopicum]|uniref:Autophagy-related protein 17 n=1 Tax=Microthyrium microscopicum TaxID=703497 RepID=A0A6A6TWT8_9PEZI|nr:hypothetical protein BT63DRAFT_460742 [Microthyrium microscopicum]
MGSPQPPDSPSSSVGSLEVDEPSLDQLVGIFLASKRSLLSTEQVRRAQEIVDTGRGAVEENAVLTARNSFVRYAVSVQLESLEAIRQGVRVVESDGQLELKETVRTLDQASARLNETLESLRNTMVEAAFRPPDEEPKCLFDFVDEKGVDELYDSIKQSMDKFDVSRKSLVDTSASFDDDLKMITDALEPQSEAEDQYINEEDDSPIPSFFYSLESNATEVASHLEGLVKHYDLCISALRHTEGGGEAMLKFTQVDIGQDQGLEGLGLGITKFDEESAPKSLGPEEHAAMLKVLTKDAGEVDEVVIEISDRLADMEEHLSQIQTYITMLRATTARQQNALRVIKTVSEHVPTYIHSCADFQAAWEEEKDILATKVDEIEGLHDFYIAFGSGYDNLILEVQRRRQVKREMEKIAKKAMTEISKLYKADMVKREDFGVEHAEYLPADIWPGWDNPPAQFEISVDGEEATKLPELHKDVVDKAIRRLDARGGL